MKLTFGIFIGIVDRSADLRRVSGGPQRGVDFGGRMEYESGPVPVARLVLEVTEETCISPMREDPRSSIGGHKHRQRRRRRHHQNHRHQHHQPFQHGRYYGRPWSLFKVQPPTCVSHQQRSFNSHCKRFKTSSSLSTHYAIPDLFISF